MPTRSLISFPASRDPPLHSFYESPVAGQPDDTITRRSFVTPSSRILRKRPSYFGHHVSRGRSLARPDPETFARCPKIVAAIAEGSLMIAISLSRNAPRLRSADRALTSIYHAPRLSRFTRPD